LFRGKANCNSCHLGGRSTAPTPPPPDGKLPNSEDTGATASTRPTQLRIPISINLRGCVPLAVTRQPRVMKSLSRLRLCRPVPRPSAELRLSRLCQFRDRKLNGGCQSGRELEQTHGRRSRPSCVCYRIT
jgi:hypothetical protein